jgi:hypothetical protein
MRLAQSLPSATLAQALFASPLQESEEPDANEIGRAVTEALARYRVDGVAAFVAQEAGDHPDLCCRRMRWALRAVADD